MSHLRFLCASLVLSACGPVPSVPDDAPIADAPIADAPIADTAADVALDAPSLPTDVGPPDPLLRTTHFGLVALEQYTARQGDFFGSASAAFDDTSDLSGVEVVDSEGDLPEGGHCLVRVQLRPFSRDPSESLVLAGTVRIGTDASEEVLTLDRVAGTGEYGPFRLAEPRWVAGEILMISTTGATVPAFDATLVVPPAVAFVVPAEPPPTDRVHVTHDAPYEIRWTPQEGGLAFIRFDQSTISGDTWRIMMLECAFPASVGTATLPRELTRGLLPSDTGTITSVTVGGAASASLEAGTFAIRATMHMISRRASAEID